MSRPLDPADKTHRHEADQSPSERTLFIAGVFAAAVVGFVIVLVHAG